MSNPNQTDMRPQFPSDAHRAALLQLSIKSMKGGGIGYDFNQLSTNDRWSIHAYDYAFRRVLLDDFSGKSPIDPHGDWYDSKLAEQAERIYRPNRPNMSSFVL